MKPNDISLENQIFNSNKLSKLIHIGSFVSPVEGEFKNRKQSKKMRLHITEIEGIKTFDFNLYGVVCFAVNEYIKIIRSLVSNVKK